MTDLQNAHYMTSDQIHLAFEDVMFRAAGDESPQVFGDAGLAMALLGAVPDPNQIIHPQERAQPALSAALSGLAKIRRDNPASPLYRVSLDPAQPLPEGVEKLPSLERLAIWLMRSGANPWLADAEGADGFDWAMRANSRTLVHMILSHPDCPAQADLEARTTAISGRVLPWIHTLAYANFLNLFDDMVDRSWNPVARDRNGWVPAAWVHGPTQLQRVLDRHPDELDDAMSVELNAAWQRRKLKKLHSTGSLDVEKLAQTLAEQTKLTPEQEELLTLQKVVEQWLAFTPTKKSYNNTGLHWRNAKEDTHADTIELMIKHFDKRYESKARTSKGMWSPLAAAFWAAARGEDDKNSAIKGLLPAAEKILSAQSPEARLAWFNEEIIPGLTNQSFVMLMAGPDMDKEQRNFFSQGLDENHAVQQRVGLATTALLTLGQRASGDQWVGILKHSWFHQGKAEGLFGYSAAPDWMWENMKLAAQAGMFRPNLDAFSSLVRQACEKLAVNDPAVPGMIPLIIKMAGLGAYDIEGGTSYSYANESAKKVQQARVKLWKATEEYLEANPEHARLLDSKDYPFGDYKHAIQKGDMDLPDALAWESMLRRRQLMDLAAEAPADASPRRAPRM